jgi:hypothetical protein
MVTNRLSVLVSGFRVVSVSPILCWRWYQVVCVRMFQGRRLMTTMLPQAAPAPVGGAAAVELGLGRIIALYYRSSTLYWNR